MHTLFIKYYDAKYRIKSENYFFLGQKKKKDWFSGPPHVFFTPRIQFFFQPQNVKKKIEAVSRKSWFSCPFLSVSILSFIMYIFKAFVYIDMHLIDR